MRILAVDTTTRSGSLAVLASEEGDQAPHLLGAITTTGDETYSTRLFRQLEFLLSELKLATADFDLFAVAAGPGSFTGLRVSLTAVKGWAEIHGKPIAAMSKLEATAFQVPPGAARIVVLEDARRGQLYGGIYQRSDQQIRRVVEDVVLSPAEMWPHLSGTIGEDDFVFASSTPELAEKMIADSPYRGIRMFAVSGVLAPMLGQLGWLKAQRGETCDALALDAHYVRRSDAELLLKK